MDDGGFEDTPPLRVHAVVSVDDGTLVVDLTGSSAQVPSGMNVPIASTHAGTYFAVRAFLGPTVPQNAGLTSRVRVIAPEGSMFNPTFPTALSARHLAVQRLTDVLIEGLCELLPERSVAASQVSFPALVFQAVDPRSGRLTLLADILGGGGGARRDAPGDDGIDPVLLELRDPAGRDRRAGVPVADRAHRAGRRLGRPGPDARRHGDPARLPPAGRPVATACTTSSRPSGVRRPRARGRRRRAPGARRRVRRAGTDDTSACRARATSTCTAATCCHWSAPAAEGSAAPSGAADLEAHDPEGGAMSESDTPGSAGPSEPPGSAGPSETPGGAARPSRSAAPPPAAPPAATGAAAVRRRQAEAASAARASCRARSAPASAA